MARQEANSKSGDIYRKIKEYHEQGFDGDIRAWNWFPVPSCRKIFYVFLYDHDTYVYIFGDRVRSSPH